MVAVSFPDKIFELSTPAGICSIIKEGENMHGKKIPKPTIRKSLATDYGVRGCLLLLTPSKTTFKTIASEVQQLGSDQGRGGTGSNPCVGPDELLLSQLFFSDWTHVSSAYGCTAWKTGGLEPVLLHYVSEKPWNATADWPDLRIWWDVAEEVIASHGEGLRVFFKRPERQKEKEVEPHKKRARVEEGGANEVGSKE